MTYHRLFGVVIKSDFPLIGLPSIAEQDHIDVHLLLGKERQPRTPRIPRMTLVWLNDTPILSHPAIGEFVYKTPSLLCIHPAPDVTVEVLQPYLLGIGMALLMTLQGRLVLHASAVTHNERGIAFAGPSGIGKSTLITDQIQHGALLIADDLVAISRDSNSLVVWRGASTIRLAATMLHHFSIDADGLLEVPPRLDKHYWQPAQQFNAAYTQLTDIFLLQKASTISLNAINGKQTLLSLLPHLYLAPYLEYLSPQQHQLIVDIAQNVPLWQLTYPHDPNALAEVRQMFKNTD